MCPALSAIYVLRGDHFLDFCRTYNFTPVPASPHALASYACYLSRKTSSYQYILNHLHAIRLLHCYNSYSTDALDSFEVSLTKRGLKRLLGTATHQKHPITPTILLEIRHHLDTSLPFHSAIWVLFCTAFFSFPRKSNLAVASATSFDPSHHLTRQDIKFIPSGAFLSIRWTKSLQHKEGFLIIPLPSIPGSMLCPATVLLHFFSLVPASPSALLFCLPATSGHRPITFTTLSTCLKPLISIIGLDPALYSPLSFRHVGATFAFQSGVPEHLINLHSDW